MVPPFSGQSCASNLWHPVGMISDIHNLQLPFLCQLSKSAPNILWSAGNSLHNQFLQVGSGNPAVMVAKISLRSVSGLEGCRADHKTL
jgi:hypothetical protein